MSDSVRPHSRKPTRLPCPWDSPGKNTGVGYHFFLQCMKVKSESEVAQSCPTLSDPMDWSLPGCSVHGIFQARVLEWGAIALHIANSLHYTVKTSTVLNSNDTPMKKKRKILYIDVRLLLFFLLVLRVLCIIFLYISHLKCVTFKYFPF